MMPNWKNELMNTRKKRLDSPPYTLDRPNLHRFDRRNIIFDRVEWDTSWEGYKRMYDKEVPSIVQQGDPGYSRVDFALSYASWIVHDAFAGAFSWDKIRPLRTAVDTIGIDWTKTRLTRTDPRKMSTYVKRAAKLFGSSLVGICRLDSEWLYADVRVPEELQYAIVVAIEMDREGISTSPAALASAATGVGYSKMAFIVAGLGEFIRNLGYKAVQCGNDTALSIPLAVDAGLGELGRNGLLITPEYGPRVRLCKVLTDLPLQPDKPMEFGVRKFCGNCKRCAQSCEAGAISMDDEPSFRIACRSNNPGALKWYVDVERCYLYWCENGTDCSNCIKACPYNMISTRRPSTPPGEFWRLDGE